MAIEIELDDSDSEQQPTRIRTQAQIRAEEKSEQHRIHKKFSANFKRNPHYAEKFMRYKDSGVMAQMFADALLNAPDDPNDYIAQFELKKHNLD